MPVPVIDLFAGPGGLGEGFSRCKSTRFEVAVSIEKDEMAFETLRLRAAHRVLARSDLVDRAVWRTWDAILADAPWNVAFEMLRSSKVEAIVSACEISRREAWNFELGPDNRGEAGDGIRQRLRPFMRGQRLPRNSVLIGGPPCQAYSVVGRSRNRGTEGYTPEGDQRHFLYREYLRVIREFEPAVFIMENVKGILSSRVSDGQIFQTILSDLRRPDVACGDDINLEYVLVAMPPADNLLDDPAPESFIVQAEAHGVPQARHRVVICGVRRDVFEGAGGVGKLRRSAPPSVRDVIGDLPRLRPGLSYRGKGLTWLDSLDQPIYKRAVEELRANGGQQGKRVAAAMANARHQMRQQVDPGFGTDRLLFGKGQMPQPVSHAAWYRDRPLSLLSNHQSRSHMPSDVARYLFVSAFGREIGESPRLADFPVALLPNHKNVDPSNPGDAIFKDRFRVQLADSFSMTVTSHIGKDGHAFIHPDPSQCRSLTVREAARLQTFPDSYVFLGNRTSQYSQVGNAVPPFLAHQIAEIVAKLLVSAKVSA